MTYTQIARELGISKTRVEEIYRNAMKKLGRNLLLRQMWNESGSRVEHTGLVGIER